MSFRHRPCTEYASTRLGWRSYSQSWNLERSQPRISSNLTQVSRRAAELPVELGETFTLAEALAAGVSRQRLRRLDIDSPFRQVYRRTNNGAREQPLEGAHAPLEWRRAHLRRAEAFARLMHGRPWFFRGVTAALLWGIPVPRGDDALEVAVHAPLRPPRRRGIRAVQVRPALAEIRELRGMRLTSPASTWAMLGSTLSLRDAVACGDAIVHRDRVPGTNRLKQSPLATVEELRAEIRKGRRRGIDSLREAVTLIRTGSASPPETHTRLLLSDAGLPEPELDFDVFDQQGRLLGCSEIAFPEFRVATEYESEHHRVDRRQWNRDIDKYQHYSDAGWEVVRVTSSLLYRHESELIRRVYEAIGRSERR